MAVEIVVRHLVNSSLAGREQRFDRDRIVFGRDPMADVSFDNERDTVVSHRHAEIVLENGALSLRDLGSRNGTFVNQRKLSGPTVVAPGDILSFGPNGPELQSYLEVAKGEPNRHQALDATIARPRASTPAPPPPVAEPFRPSPPPPSPPSPPPRPASVSPTPEYVSQTTFFRVIDQVMDRRRGGTAWPMTLLAILGSLAGGAALGYFVLPGVVGTGRPGAVAPAAGLIDEPPPPAESIASLGRLEPDGGVIEVGGTSGDRVGRLAEGVTEGAMVKKGDALAYLASHDALEAELRATVAARDEARKALALTRLVGEAQVKEAEAGVDEVQGLDKQIEAQGDQIRLLDKAVEIVTKDRQDLEKPPAAPNLPRPTQDQITRAQMQEEQAKRQRKAAESGLAQYLTTRDLKKKSALAKLQTVRESQKLQESRIGLDVAEANVRRAEAQRDRAIIRAPRDGRILRVVTGEGETLVGRPIVELGDTGRFRVVAEVDETEVRRVKAGQKAVIRSPALSKDLNGIVSEIAWTVKRNDLRDVNPMAKEDLRVVEVRIALDPRDVEANRDLLSRLIGLQVHAWILPEGGGACGQGRGGPR